jgi:hypothetical protein
MVSHFFSGHGRILSAIASIGYGAGKYRTPPYGAAKIRYVARVPYIVAVRYGTVPCGTVRYRYRAVPYVNTSRYQPMDPGIYTKEYLFFLDREKIGIV